MSPSLRAGLDALHEAFKAESDALYASFKRGEITHAEYRRRLDPLEAKLRTDVRAAWAEAS